MGVHFDGPRYDSVIAKSNSSRSWFLLSSTLDSEKGNPMTPCYCAACKKELPISSITGENSAWCAECSRVVDLSCFKVPGWVTAVLVVLTMHADLLRG